MPLQFKDLPFDAEGHSKHMENGTDHTPVTLSVELLDNSDKAIRILKNNDGFIKYYLDDLFEVFIDNGVGISSQNIDIISKSI